MFGLMRRAPRLAYCGSCKTLGVLYGQRSRLLLNHDMVFLSELLMERSGEPHWTKAYRSRNCFAMPESGELPLALEYGATAAIALAHFHVKDHIADSESRVWSVAAKLISPAYEKAAARLRAWDFPLQEMEALLNSQTSREANPESLDHVAEPTAGATAMMFAHGARVIGASGTADKLGELGYTFGRLIYVLDAWEDRERDAKTGAFNPLRIFPQIDGRAEIFETASQLEKELSERLGARLRRNVEARLGVAAFAGGPVPIPPVPKPKAGWWSNCCCCDSCDCGDCCCGDCCCDSCCSSCDCS